jgi:hypothetical protein
MTVRVKDPDLPPDASVLRAYEASFNSDENALFTVKFAAFGLLPMVVVVSIMYVARVLLLLHTWCVLFLLPLPPVYTLAMIDDQCIMNTVGGLTFFLLPCFPATRPQWQGGGRCHA